MKTADIDIDFPTSFDVKELFPQSVKAIMVNDNEIKKHPCGAYFQNMPVDDVTGMAAIPYDKAPDYGYSKIDFLHLSILDGFSSKTEIREMLKKEPDWSLMLREDIVEQLFQLKKHYEIISKIRPKSVVEIADIIALIRPEKRNLLKDYLSNREKTRPKLYRQKDDDKSSFKLSHALAYAHVVVLQLHVLNRERENRGIFSSADDSERNIIIRRPQTEINRF